MIEHSDRVHEATFTVGKLFDVGVTGWYSPAEHGFDAHPSVALRFDQTIGLHFSTALAPADARHLAEALIAAADAVEAAHALT